MLNLSEAARIEERVRSLSSLVKEIALTKSQNGYFAYIVPDLLQAQEQGIINIRHELHWYAVELYNIDAAKGERIVGFAVINRPLPKTDEGSVDYAKLPGMLKARQEPDEAGEAEADEAVYRAIKAFVATLTQKPVYPSAHFELDLDLDSLDYVQLFAFVEASFGLAMDEKRFASLMRMGDFCAYVREYKTSYKPAHIDWGSILSQKSGKELLFSPLKLIVYKTVALPLFKLYFRLEISGQELIPAHACIIAPSHQSMLDGFLIASALPYRVLVKTFFLAFELVFGTNLMRPFSRNGQLILINDNDRLKESMQLAAAPLQQGLNLVLFPEGARSRDGKLLRFKRFFAILARELKVPVVPVVLDGSFEALRAGMYVPRPAKIRIRFLAPLTVGEEDADTFTQRVKSAIQEEMDRHPMR